MMAFSQDHLAAIFQAIATEETMKKLHQDNKALEEKNALVAQLALEKEKKEAIEKSLNLKWEELLEKCFNLKVALERVEQLAPVQEKLEENLRKVLSLGKQLEEKEKECLNLEEK